MTNNQINKDRLHRVCRIGKGADCCKYITCGPMGFCCEKKTTMKVSIDAAALRGMTAQGDNCEGLPLEESSND